MLKTVYHGNLRTSILTSPSISFSCGLHAISTWMPRSHPRDTRHVPFHLWHVFTFIFCRSSTRNDCLSYLYDQCANWFNRSDISFQCNLISVTKPSLGGKLKGHVVMIKENYAISEIELLLRGNKVFGLKSLKCGHCHPTNTPTPPIMCSPGVVKANTRFSFRIMWKNAALIPLSHP